MADGLCMGMAVLLQLQPLAGLLTDKCIGAAIRTVCAPQACLQVKA